MHVKNYLHILQNNEVFWVKVTAPLDVAEAREKSRKAVDYYISTNQVDHPDEIINAALNAIATKAEKVEKKIFKSHIKIDRVGDLSCTLKEKEAVFSLKSEDIQGINPADLAKHITQLLGESLKKRKS